MKINTNNNCNIVIYDDTEYPINDLSYQDSVSLYIVQLNKAGTISTLYNKLDDHSNSSGQPIVLNPQEDGFITACHIILPKLVLSSDYLEESNYITNKKINDSIRKYLGNVENINEIEQVTGNKYVRKENFISNEEIKNFILQYFNQNISVEPNTPTSSGYMLKTNNIKLQEIVDMVNTYFNGNISIQDYLYLNSSNIGYYSDGRKIYKKDSEGNIIETTIEELLEVNPAAYNFVKQTQKFFSVCYLRKCFISLCQQLFNSKLFGRCFNSKINSQLVYKRDLVWAALNVIQYLIDSDQLEEAQRILTEVTGCNGLCSNKEMGKEGCGCTSFSSVTSDCGCKK